jgi:hypothetical protein
MIDSWNPNLSELLSIKLTEKNLLNLKNWVCKLSNYRPITLLNTDTKLIAYALAQRFKNV